MVNVYPLIALVPLLPLVGFLLISWRVNRMAYGTTAVVACGVVFASFIMAVVLFFELLGMPEDTPVF